MNGQVFKWVDISAGVPQWSVLGPLLFLIYINDLAISLSSNSKLFADDTSLFSVTHDINTTVNELKNELLKINSLAYQCKMSVNPHPSKQAQENNPPLFFSSIQVLQYSSQKHVIHNK